MLTWHAYGYQLDPYQKLILYFGFGYLILIDFFFSEQTIILKNECLLEVNIYKKEKIVIEWKRIVLIKNIFFFFI